MDFEKSKKLLWILSAFYFLLAVMIWFVAGDGFRQETVSGSTLTPSAVIGEVVDGMTVDQRLQINADEIEAVDVTAATFARENTGILHIDILSEDGTVLASVEGRTEDMQDNRTTRFVIPGGISGRKGQYAVLRFRTEGCQPGNAVSLYYGTGINVGKFDIQKNIDTENAYTIDGTAGAGTLCVSFSGHNNLIAYKIYWPAILLIYGMAALAVFLWWKQAKRGKHNPLTMFCTMAIRYNFLIRQLVSRDFKVKYKRSLLGVGWSILNPLLTMLVQYVVFSTLFSNGTQNYPLYLLSGIVFFSFFNEALTMGMTSITNNAPLIRKVYMPKYIFPVSRVFSSLINLGTSMIPLFAVMLLTGTWPKPSLLLLIFDILCLILFVMGMSLILCTSMTFFQDTLFLWNVASMIWMYLTPIFYMDTIIPEKLLPLYHMNPMYQYINFARICIIDGVSPSPSSYLWCILTSLTVLIVGIVIFRKHQNRFVLYL